MRIRLENANAEMTYGNVPGNFDAIVVNDDLEQAIADLMEQISIWYPERNFSV